MARTYFLEWHQLSGVGLSVMIMNELKPRKKVRTNVTTILTVLLKGIVNKEFVHTG